MSWHGEFQIARTTLAALSAFQTGQQLDQGQPGEIAGIDSNRSFTLPTDGIEEEVGQVLGGGGEGHALEQARNMGRCHCAGFCSGVEPLSLLPLRSLRTRFSAVLRASPPNIAGLT